MPTTIVGVRSVFETVGSSVAIGDHKTKKPVGATVLFNDSRTANLGKTYFTEGTAFGDFHGAQSTSKDELASGSVTYKSTSDAEVYTMEYSTSSEPVDTHPHFQKIAGDVKKPLHGAVFDPDGSFRKFKHTLELLDLGRITIGGEVGDIPVRNGKGVVAKEGQQNWFAGVSSYLEASGIWTKSFKSDRVPTLEGLGKISVPPGDAPTPEGRNWLYTGFSASFTSPAEGERNRKLSCDVTMEWTLSGRRGWDEDIYGVGAADGGALRMGNLGQIVGLGGARLN